MFEHTCFESKGIALVLKPRSEEEHTERRERRDLQKDQRQYYCGERIKVNQSKAE